MLTWISRILSLAIVVLYLTVLHVSEPEISQGTYQGYLAMLLPLALIWFPQQLGEFTGYVGHGGQIDTQTPAWMVAGAGWFLLVGLPLLLILLN